MMSRPSRRQRVVNYPHSALKYHYNGPSGALGQGGTAGQSDLVAAQIVPPYKNNRLEYSHFTRERDLLLHLEPELTP